jgi:hypothetical protein
MVAGGPNRSLDCTSSSIARSSAPGRLPVARPWRGAGCGAQLLHCARTRRRPIPTSRASGPTTSTLMTDGAKTRRLRRFARQATVGQMPRAMDEARQRGRSSSLPVLRPSANDARPASRHAHCWCEGDESPKGPWERLRRFGVRRRHFQNSRFYRPSWMARPRLESGTPRGSVLDFSVSGGVHVVTHFAAACRTKRPIARSVGLLVAPGRRQRSALRVLTRLAAPTRGRGAPG